MKIDNQTLLATVSTFVENQRGLDPSTLDAGTQLFQEGFLDSFSVVELIQILEQQFPDRLSAGDLIPEDFSSVGALAKRLQEL